MKTAPLPQSAYVWQRDWTPAVSQAIRSAAPHLDGFVVLGAEVAWKDGEPHVLRPPVDWKVFAETGKSLGIALRIDPGDPATVKAHASMFADLAKSLISQAKENGVTCTEFQIDYDCPTSRLALYRDWLPTIRAAVQPAHFVITALPAWLGHSDTAALVREADEFILQVHSVPTRDAGENVALFDDTRAKRWIARAAKLPRPFTVSLPTYSALVGYDSQGHSLGMALDGIQPRWPAGTRIREYSSDAVTLSHFIAEWRQSRPVSMQSVIWYRLPIGGGERNWRLPTFTAVLAGREPTHLLEVRVTGDNPADVSLLNSGEVEENLESTILVHWDTAAEPIAEALPGWTVEQSPHEARFIPTAAPMSRLLPGGHREIGWLRFNSPTRTYAKISP